MHLVWCVVAFGAYCADQEESRRERPPKQSKEVEADPKKELTVDSGMCSVRGRVS